VNKNSNSTPIVKTAAHHQFSWYATNMQEKEKQDDTRENFNRELRVNVSVEYAL
jgi:hypothetical protein